MAGRHALRSSLALPVEDLPFLTDLADRTALALENARLYEDEREVAHVLQQTMLAGDPPVDPRFQVATHYRPAFVTLEVGGDWYDTFAVGEGRIGIGVGDVVGRGIQAASAMGQLRSAIRALAGADLRPARLIERLDVFVEQIETARWATLAYAEVDLGTGHVRFACAGHPPPLLVEPGSDPRFLWDGRSTPLGMPVDARAEARSRCGRDRGSCCTPTGSSSVATDRSTKASTGSPQSSRGTERVRCRRW